MQSLPSFWYLLWWPVHGCLEYGALLGVDLVSYRSDLESNQSLFSAPPPLQEDGGEKIYCALKPLNLHRPLEGARFFPNGEDGEDHPTNWKFVHPPSPYHQHHQGFLNSGKGWWGIRNFTVGGGGERYFFTRWREPEEEWFCQFKPFSKLKAAFRECWTSIKINMTCVSKEYEFKNKKEQEQWLQLKMLFIGL